MTPHYGCVGECCDGCDDQEPERATVKLGKEPERATVELSTRHNSNLQPTVELSTRHNSNQQPTVELSTRHNSKPYDITKTISNENIGKTYTSDNADHADNTKSIDLPMHNDLRDCLGRTDLVDTPMHDHSQDCLGRTDHDDDDEDGWSGPDLADSVTVVGESLDQRLHDFDDEDGDDDDSSDSEDEDQGKRKPAHLRPRLCELGEPPAHDPAFLEKSAVIRAQCVAEREAESARRAATSRITPICPLRGPQGESDLDSWLAERDREMERAGWQRFSLAIDSGAAETVIPHNEVHEHPIRETAASKGGVTYASATGAPIPNLGEQILPLLTQEGSLRSMTFQAAPVDRALGSVKRMCRSGHMVVFDDDGSYVLNKSTGEINWLREEHGNYMLDTWIMPRAPYEAMLSETGFSGPR